MLPTIAEVFQHQDFGAVRTLIKNGEPLFVAKDVCKCLDIKNHSHALRRIDKEDIMKLRIETNGGKQIISFVNESGLYQLIFMSRKSKAKKLVKWVTYEVLPSIRKTGKYKITNGFREEDLPKIEKMIREWSEHIDKCLYHMLAEGEARK